MPHPKPGASKASQHAQGLVVMLFLCCTGFDREDIHRRGHWEAQTGCLSVREHAECQPRTPAGTRLISETVFQMLTEPHPRAGSYKDGQEGISTIKGIADSV